MLRHRRYLKDVCTAVFVPLLIGTAYMPFQVFAASPEFAYTEEKWASLRDNKLEFNEIADLVHEYNTTVQQNVLSYNDYKGKSSWDISKDYYDSAENVLERISYPDDSDADYASLISSALSSEISADSLVEQGDNNVDDGETKKLEYDKEEASIVKEAQLLMVSCWNSAAEIESCREAVTEAESSYQSVLTRISAGMSVLSEEKTAAEAVTKAKASLLSAESSLESTQKELCILLGWGYDDEVEIGSLPEPDMDYINSIDIESDVLKALDNNYDLAVTSLQISNAQSDTIRKTKQESYDELKNTVITSVRNSYSSLLLAASSYEEAEESYEIQQNELAASELRLAAGTITKNSYESRKSACSTARVNAETGKLALLKAQLEYQWAVKGLAS